MFRASPPSRAPTRRQAAQSVASLVSQVEAHLARNPNDGAGWEVIAPVYLRLGRFDDAVMARRKAIALNGDTAARESDLGEALVAAANGVVTDEAKQAFQHAVAGDPQDAESRAIFSVSPTSRTATATPPPPNGAPCWTTRRATRRGRISCARRWRASPARRSAATWPERPGDVAAADNMKATQRTEMIRGMVQRLADRLHADGNDVDGWLRLVRAYAVLGDRDKAKDAAADAKRALSDHPDEVKRIDDLVKGLGLEG